MAPLPEKRASAPPVEQKSTLLPYLALLLAVFCIGMSGIFVRWANVPGSVAAFYRMGVSALVLAPGYISRRRRGLSAAAGRRAVILALASGAFLGLDVGLWAIGVMLSGATNPTLLANTAPLWVGLGTLVFLRKKLPVWFWVGLALSLAGAGLVLGLESLTSVVNGQGSLFGLAAGFFYGGFFLLAEESRRSLDSFSSVWLAGLSSSLVLLVVTQLLGNPLTGYPLQSYLVLIAFGLLSQVLGYLAINYALGELPSTLVSTTLLGQPIVTGILAALWLGEVFSGLQVVGGLAVLGGVAIVHQSRRRVD